MSRVTIAMYIITLVIITLVIITGDLWTEDIFSLLNTLMARVPWPPWLPEQRETPWRPGT